MAQMMHDLEKAFGENYFLSGQDDGGIDMSDGDFNVIEFPCGKLGGDRIISEMRVFQIWSTPPLLSYHLNGSSYTWSNHQMTPSILRLDRFLLCLLGSLISEMVGGLNDSPKAILRSVLELLGLLK